MMKRSTRSSALRVDLNASEHTGYISFGTTTDSIVWTYPTVCKQTRLLRVKVAYGNEYLLIDPLSSPTDDTQTCHYMIRNGSAMILIESISLPTKEHVKCVEHTSNHLLIIRFDSSETKEVIVNLSENSKYKTLSSLSAYLNDSMKNYHTSDEANDSYPNTSASKKHRSKSNEFIHYNDTNVGSKDTDQIMQSSYVPETPVTVVDDREIELDVSENDDDDDVSYII